MTIPGRGRKTLDIVDSMQRTIKNETGGQVADHDYWTLLYSVATELAELWEAVKGKKELDIPIAVQVRNDVIQELKAEIEKLKAEYECVCVRGSVEMLRAKSEIIAELEAENKELRTNAEAYKGAQEYLVGKIRELVK